MVEDGTGAAEDGTGAAEDGTGAASDTGGGAVRFVAEPGALDAVVYDENGLVPAIIQDAETNDVLMLGYMSAESLAESMAQGRTVFWSRSRRELWRKGDTSGDHQYIRSMSYDCDGDTLLFRVEQIGGGACHTGEYSCFHRTLGQPA